MQTFESYAAERLPSLLGAARAICGDAALAEDLIQDVLIKLHGRWGAIGEVDALDAYVRRMLVNEFISWRRKWARMIPFAEPREQAATIDHRVESGDLWLAVRRLPPRQRVVIGLHYFEDLSDKQIAAALGCAESTVRVHAARALATLRIDSSALFVGKDS